MSIVTSKHLSYLNESKQMIQHIMISNGTLRLNGDTVIYDVDIVLADLDAG